MIFCPYHAEQGQYVEAIHVGKYDDEENPIGIVEMDRFQCSVDPEHIWEHPSRNFWLRWMGWGADWRKMRDRWSRQF